MVPECIMYEIWKSYYTNHVMKELRHKSITSDKSLAWFLQPRHDIRQMYRTIYANPCETVETRVENFLRCFQYLHRPKWKHERLVKELSTTGRINIYDFLFAYHIHAIE